MIKGEYKRILDEIFDVLGFSVEEKAKAQETFKKKLAFNLLKSIEKELPQEQQGWLVDMNMGQADSRFLEIQKTIQGMYSEDQLYEKTRPIFKAILDDYLSFMSEGLDALSVEKLQKIAAQI